ncbi:MAG: hypothetical protein GX282_05585 [Campylobacteraceae bacterium]|nr:hypothetical protein [Campylobacteraceae bacterium]
MKEEILSAFPNADVEFMVGDRGDFKVEVDGEVVFYNKNYVDYRFPNVGEVNELIAKLATKA